MQKYQLGKEVVYELGCKVIEGGLVSSDPRSSTVSEGLLSVSEVHKIRWRVAGNPEGEPVLCFHGGPGGAIKELDKRSKVFDLGHYKMLEFDQRGCGKSEPLGCLENNTTWDLLDDAEKLREHLGIKQWKVVFGGSWGSTLALAYACKYTEKLRSLIVYGVFTGRPSEVDSMLEMTTKWLMPEHYDTLMNQLTPLERTQPLLYTAHKRLSQFPMDKLTKEQVAFAEAFCNLEASACEFPIKALLPLGTAEKRKKRKRKS